MLSALKADADLRDIPVVIVTMLSDRGIGLSLGAADVLTKPVDRAQLPRSSTACSARWSGLSCRGRSAARGVIRLAIERMGFAVAEAEMAARRSRGRRSFGAGHDPAGPDDAGDGRL